MHQINQENWNQLIAVCKTNLKFKALILDVLESFEAYHNAIYKMETRLLVDKKGAAHATP